MHLKNIHWSKLHTVLVSLVAKAVYEGFSALSQTDLFVLTHTFSRLSEETNYDYVITRRLQLIRLSPICKIIIADKAFVKLSHLTETLRQEKIGLLNRDAIPTAHSYFGNFAQLKTEELVSEVSLRYSKLPPKRFIGVGYKDIGNMKDLAYDGSPSWQEVAAANLQDTSLRATSFTYHLILTNWGYRKLE